MADDKTVIIGKLNWGVCDVPCVHSVDNGTGCDVPCVHWKAMLIVDNENVYCGCYEAGQQEYERAPLSLGGHVQVS
jgi:hypothetical protein